jgi:hypothetical protein
VASGFLLATTPAAAQPPALQVLEWEFGSIYPLPVSSHFGEVLALSRGGTLLLVGAPHDGARPGYTWDEDEGWGIFGGLVYDAGDQLQRFAPDTLGVAFTELEPGGTTAVGFHLAPGPLSDPILSGIPGPVTAIAKQDDFLAVGEAAHAGGAGRVRIFELDLGTGTWELAETFVGQAGAALGFSLALDGDLLVAGAPSEGDCGSVYVYARTSSWLELQEIECPSATQIDADFGETVALDGGILAVGAPLLDRPNPGGAVDAGGVYVYRADLFLFQLESFLRPPEAAAGDRFGSSLALYSWSPTQAALLVGSPFAEVGLVEELGSATLYLDWGEWRRLPPLVVLDLAGSRYGTSVALGRHGAVVGAPRSDGNSVFDQGRAVAWNGILPLFYDGFDRGDADAWSTTVP